MRQCTCFLTFALCIAFTEASAAQTQNSGVAGQTRPGQSAAAQGQGVAVNAGRDANITINNYRQDPKTAAQVDALLKQLEAAQQRERFLQGQVERAQAERDDERRKREQQERAVAGVVIAANQPNPSPEALAAVRGLEQGRAGPSEDFYLERERAAAKAGRDSLLAAAEAARSIGALAFQTDVAKALDAYRRATQYDPEDIWGWYYYGDLQAKAGNVQAAQSAYESGGQAAQRKLSADPRNTEWQRDLSISHNKIGDMPAAQGDTRAALEAYRKSLAIRERLAAADPDNAQWQADVVISVFKLTSEKLSLPADQARRLLLQARAIVDKLTSIGELRKSQQSWTSEINQRLSALK